MKYFIYHKSIFSLRGGKHTGIEVRLSETDLGTIEGFSKLKLGGSEDEFRRADRVLSSDKDPELLTTVISDRKIEDLIHYINRTAKPLMRDSNWEQNIGEYRV